MGAKVGVKDGTALGMISCLFGKRVEVGEGERVAVGDGERACGIGPPSFLAQPKRMPAASNKGPSLRRNCRRLINCDTEAIV